MIVNNRFKGCVSFNLTGWEKKYVGRKAEKKKFGKEKDK